MTNYTCTITYPGGVVNAAWQPQKPTAANPCLAGDTVEFSSPDNLSGLDFPVDSPFEPNKGPQKYIVTQGGTLPLKTIDPRVNAMSPKGKSTVFTFNCMPGDVLVPGNGSDVPVGGGH